MGKRPGMASLELEEYMAVYEEASPSSPDEGTYSRFTLPKLHQIIRMHGFLKLHNRPKRELLDAVESIDLMPPARSTLLHRGVSPGALPPANRVVADLVALGWAECPVEAVRALVPVTEAEYGEESPAVSPPLSPSPSRPSPSPSPVRCVRRTTRRRSCPAAFVVGGRRPRTKRKRASINALVAADLRLPSQAPSSDTTPPPPPSSPPPPTPPPPSSPPPPARSPPPSPPSPPYPPPPPTAPPYPPQCPPPGFLLPLRRPCPPPLPRPTGFPLSPPPPFLDSSSYPPQRTTVPDVPIKGPPLRS